MGDYRRRNDYDDELYDERGGYDFYGSRDGLTQQVPRARAQSPARGYDRAPAPAPAPMPVAPPSPAPVAQDRRGTVTSVFSLLLSLAILVLSVAGAAVPPLMASRPSSSGVLNVVMYVVAGLAAILAAFVLGTPTILLALRAVGKAQGQPGRGRGMFSVVVAALAPTVALVFLGMFAAGQASTIKASDVIPQVTTDSEGHMHISAPEALGPEMTDAIERFNELSEEGYSIGTDADGNIVATSPDGKTVTIDQERLEELESRL